VHSNPGRAIVVVTLTADLDHPPWSQKTTPVRLFLQPKAHLNECLVQRDPCRTRDRNTPHRLPASPSVPVRTPYAASADNTIRTPAFTQPRLAEARRQLSPATPPDLFAYGWTHLRAQPIVPGHHHPLRRRAGGLASLLGSLEPPIRDFFAESERISPSSAVRQVGARAGRRVGCRSLYTAS
jgi:hypothetical protein